MPQPRITEGQTNELLNSGATTTRQPFAALISVSSLLAALLYVAGFAYRWAYYYNFGVQHVVFKLGVQSFLVTAIELVRTPHNLLFFLIWVAMPVVAFNLGLNALSSAAGRPDILGKLAGITGRALGLTSPLVSDLLRAAVLVYAVYMFGSALGYKAFRSNILDTRSNPLPAVTLIMTGDGPESATSVGCGATTAKNLTFVGDADRLRTIQDSYRTCNSRTSTWRLLYRDDEAIYLFASVSPAVFNGGRPLTLVLPNTKGTYLILE
jgi:hypothetical protein